MRLYLVRHGEARSSQEDPEKRLSTRGLADVEKVAAFLRPQGLVVDAIWYSGKTRAAETAEVLSEAVTARQGVVRRPGLEPNDPVAPVLNDVLRADGDIMIVGHLPFLVRLASKLLAGDESVLRLNLCTAAALCLGRDPEQGWYLAWMVTPDVLA